MLEFDVDIVGKLVEVFAFGFFQALALFGVFYPAEPQFGKWNLSLPFVFRFVC